MLAIGISFVVVVANYRGRDSWVHRYNVQASNSVKCKYFSTIYKYTLYQLNKGKLNNLGEDKAVI